MSDTPRRPKPWSIGPIRVRVIRGPHPDKGWYFRLERYIDGKDRTLWTGWARDKARITQRAAEMLAEEPRPTLDRPSPKLRFETVRDLMEYWVGAQEQRGDIRPRTKKVARSIGRKIVKLIGDVRLARLDIGVLEMYRDVRLHQGCASQGLLEELKIVRRAHRWAQQRGLVENRHLPMPRLKVRPKREKVTPTPAEFWKVHAWMAEHSDRTWRPRYLQILASTGCRASEVAGLLWSQVDLRNAVLHIDGKTDRRDVRMPPALVEMLKAIPRTDDPRIFGVSAKTVKDSLGAWMRDKVPWDELGIRRFTPQGVRRMVVDQLYASGADIGVVSQHLGHSPQVALKYYRQATAAQTRQALTLAGIGVVVESDTNPQQQPF